VATLAVNSKGCMTKPYWQKLQDPRWQKKRLEIMNRAGFKCEKCDDDKATLHIHHGYYEKGFEPWDYANETLWCLCGSCHKETQEAMRNNQRQLAMFKPEDVCCWVAYWLEQEREWGDKPRVADLHNYAKSHFGTDHDDFVNFLSVVMQHSPWELYEALLNLYEKAIFEEPRWLEELDKRSDKEPGV